MSKEFRVKQLENCNVEMFGDLVLTYIGSQLPSFQVITNKSYPTKVKMLENGADSDSIKPGTKVQHRKSFPAKFPFIKCKENEQRRASLLVDQLLLDIHRGIHSVSDYNSTTSGKSNSRHIRLSFQELAKKDLDSIHAIVCYLSNLVDRAGAVLVRRLKRRDSLRRQQEARCDVITNQLIKLSSGECSSDLQFSIDPSPGASGFSQWATAMKMVAQLPGGIPPEFRSRLWLQLADRHLTSKGVDWARVERTCFSEWAHPEDSELGVQIVKDLHRTGCSLFCGKDGKENQALLKKVLLAYARWNKSVGYCQGFNMLAALILQVTDRNETDALKLMIYLIEGVLPDSYFADSLRGLSVDMAVFRELLRSRLPRLSRHLDLLQNAAKEGTTSYEPPLTNVFTMQWFLTLFCNCLPQPTVLRVWDLILLEGNEILLRTALAIWEALEDRILNVRSADEFYCIMGSLTRELLEFDLIDGNSLIKSVVSIGSLSELKTLREHYLYNINPWGSLPITNHEKQLKTYPKERIALDISALKKQYTKLRQRQRQAHIIFTAAITRQPPPTTPVAMNHLLLGKSALVPAKRLGPPKGAIPPARPPTTLQWKDAPRQSSSSSSSDTELCDDQEDSDSSAEDLQQTKMCIADNLIDIETKDLMNKDNNLEDIVSATDLTQSLVDLNCGESSFVPKDNCDSSDINLASSSQSLVDSKKFEIDDDDEENADFENFLKDRIRSLKEGDSNDAASNLEDDRITYARRNSNRALQIIQENSIILHRILQCQSRLSPSPPLCDIDTINLECGELETDFLKHGDPNEASTSKDNNLVCDKDKGVSDLLDLQFYDNMDKSECVNAILDEFVKPENEGSQFTDCSEESKELSCLKYQLGETLDAHCDNILISTEDPNENISVLDKKDLFEESLISSDTLLFKAEKDEISEIEKDNSSKDEPCTKLENNLIQFYEPCENIKPNEYSKELNETFTEKVSLTQSDLKEANDDDSFQCGSKYSDIIAKSKNLDEKYNNLILKTNSDSNNKPSPLHKMKTNSFDTQLLASENRKLLDSIKRDSSDSKISEVKLANLKENQDLLSSIKLDYLDLNLTQNNDCLNRTLSNDSNSEKMETSNETAKADFTDNNSTKTVLQLDSDSLKNFTKNDDYSAFKESKKKYPALDTIPTPGISNDLKSPNKVFNPFPVPLTSRQNKDVVVKLGLYKK